MSDRKMRLPLDGNGHPINRAMGVPVLVDSIQIGTSRWVDLMDLSGQGDRVFTGLAIINPSSVAKLYLSFDDVIGSEIKSIVAQTSGSITLDNLSFGPGIRDDFSGKECQRIRALLSATAGVSGSATINYTGITPTDGMLVNIGDLIYEFSSDKSPASGHIAVDIGASADASWTNFVTVVNANDQASLLTINAGTKIVTVTSNYVGSYSDGYTVADGSVPTGAVFSGNTAGGSGGITPTLMVW